MKKNKFDKIVSAAVKETKAALQTVYDTLSKGQKQKLLKNAAVKTLFGRYSVTVDESTDPNSENLTEEG